MTEVTQTKRFEFTPVGEADKFVVFEGHADHPFWNRQGEIAHGFSDLSFEQAKFFAEKGVLQMEEIYGSETYDGYVRQADETRNCHSKSQEDCMADPIAGLKDPDFGVRYQTLEVIRTNGWSASPAAVPLAEIFLDQKEDFRFRLAVGHTLGSLGFSAVEAIPLVTEALKDPHRQIRSFAEDLLPSIDAQAPMWSEWNVLIKSLPSTEHRTLIELYQDYEVHMGALEKKPERVACLVDYFRADYGLLRAAGRSEEAAVLAQGYNDLLPVLSHNSVGAVVHLNLFHLPKERIEHVRSIALERYSARNL